MSYWIFTVISRKTDEGLFEAETILNTRIQDKFWGLGERTPNRRAIKKGDKVIFYVGLPITSFVCSAELASDSFVTSEKQKEQFGHEKKFYHTDYGVELTNIQKWSERKRVQDLAPYLKFMENKENWGAYFQGGIRQLTEEDYLTVIGTNVLRSTPKAPEDVISESQFALESHLEDFIDKNWNHIDFGNKIERYQVDDQNGRQFPAGQWSIDFLCVDKISGDLVVIELKRGKTSDATVGQVLRYIGWVNENLAKPGQKTRGIIIAQEVDDALKYAVRSLPNVSVMTYKVDFKLKAFQS